MKLVRPSKHDPSWYLHFTDDCFAHLINDWEQVFGSWNWYTFHWIHLYMENEIMTGGFEFEFVVLGLGFRVRWNYALEESPVGKSIKDYKEERLEKVPLE